MTPSGSGWSCAGREADARSLANALTIAPYTTWEKCLVCNAPIAHPCTYRSAREAFPPGTPRPEPHNGGGRQMIELSGLPLMEVIIEARRDVIDEARLAVIGLIDAERGMWAEFEEDTKPRDGATT